VSEPRKPTVAEIKANMRAFVADLSRRTGVDIDADEVWEDAKQRIVRESLADPQNM